MLSCLSITRGQETLLYESINRVTLITNKKGFRGQILKKKRNGMGVQRMKKGFVYAGDYYQDEQTGFGMMFAPVGENINNCHSCTVYVGQWKKGKKSGIGTCYDQNGELLYYGHFSEDRPIDSYPNIDSSINKTFQVLEISEQIYFIGETSGGNAEGYGMILFRNNDVWLSSFKNGIGNGIGIYMYSGGEWETFNNHDGKYDVVSSSKFYRTMDAIKKQIVREGLNYALFGISNALEDLATKMEQTNQVTNVVETDMGTGTASNNYSSTQHGSTTKNNHANWKALDRAYGGYEDQLIRMKSSGNYDKQEVRNIQRKMKDIRKKIYEQSGHNRAISSMENWTP